MTQHHTRTIGSTVPASALTRAGAVMLTAWAALTMAALAVADLARGDAPVTDRGSDSTEKSLMIILSISIGAAVTVAAGIFIASKTALFK